MIKHQLFIAAALLVGVAIGYFVHYDEPASPAASAPELPRKHAPIADADSAFRIKNLERRIAELEAALAAAKAQPATNAQSVADAAKAQPPARPDFRARMEELKKSNPAQYAQMTNRMANFRRQMRARRQARQDFFASLDTSHMRAESKQSLDKLQAALDNRAAIEEVDFEKLSEAERRDTMRKIWESERTIRELNSQVRSDLLSETVQQAGFEGDDATDFVSAIQEVLDATENSRGPGPGGPGGPGGQGGPGPGGSGGGRQGAAVR